MKQIRAINLPQLGFSIYRGLLLAMQILQAFEPFKRTQAQPSQINITAHIFEKSLPKAFVAPPGKAATPDTSSRRCQPAHFSAHGKPTSSVARAWTRISVTNKSIDHHWKEGCWHTAKPQCGAFGLRTLNTTRLQNKKATKIALELVRRVPNLEAESRSECKTKQMQSEGGTLEVGSWEIRLALALAL